MVDQVISQVKNLPDKSIIFISGFGGSGKSTLAKQINGELNIPIISIDDFYIDKKDYHYWSCFNYKELITKVIVPFKQNEIIKYNAYNWGNPNISKVINISISEKLIIEGVGLFSEELLKYSDLSIWIDCTLEESIKRGKNRDNNTYKVDNDDLWDGIWKHNDVECFRAYEPLSKADIIFICDE